MAVDSKKPDEGDDLFINKLLEETYSFIPESDTGRDSGDLLKYFNNKVSDATSSEGTFEYTQFDLVFNQETECFRFESLDKEIDFPSNWSFFRELKTAMQSGTRFFLPIDHQNNAEGLHDILSEVMNFPCQAIFYSHQGVTGLCISPSGEKVLGEEAFFQSQIPLKPILKAA